MPPRPQLPNQPAGMPSWYSPSGPPESVGYSTGAGTSQSTSRRFVSGPNGPVMVPEGLSEADGNQWVQAYNTHIATLTQAWQQSSGLDRKRIEAQIEDAKKARENAMEIARMQDATSRYGTDVASRDRMRQLQEDQRQFDARQKLDILGKQIDYLSTPDKYIQGSQFINLSSRMLAGQPGDGGTAATSFGGPQAKTMQDFAVLQSGGVPGRQVSNAAATAGGAGADKRQQAVSSLIKALPPSEGEGLDAGDYAVLDAAKAIYGMKLTPRQQAQIRNDETFQATLGSAGRRLGYQPDQWMKQQQRTLPSQGRASAA